MTITVERENGLYHIKSDSYNETLRRVGNSIAGVWWEPEPKAWVGYADGAQLLIKEGRERGLVIKGEVDLPTVPKFTTAPIALKDLRPYQQEGALWVSARMRQGCILAYDMGLGKTATMIRVLRAHKRDPAVIVAPAPVCLTWEEELAQWWPEAFEEPDSVRILKGQKAYPLTSVPITILNYSLLPYWADELAKFARILVLDEAHQVGHRFVADDKTKSSKRSVAVRHLASVCVQGRVALTGTPMLNRPRDLWNLVDIISPGRFGKFWAYGRRYCGGIEKDIHSREGKFLKKVWDFSGSSNEPELQERLRVFMLRKTTEEVALQLPARTRQVIEIETGKKLTPKLGGAPSHEVFVREAMRAADAKLPAVIEIAKDTLEQTSEPLIIYTVRRHIAEYIAAQLVAAGYETLYVHGEYDAAKRRDIIRKHPRVLVATIDSVGQGINDLVYASRGIFAEWTYEPWKIAQTEKRQHRSGQKNPVHFIYPVARGSIDEAIRDLVIGKLKKYTAVIGDGADAGLEEDIGLKKQSPEELMKELFDLVMKT